MRIPTILLLSLLSNFIIAQDILLFDDTKSETLVFSASNIGSSSSSLRQILQSIGHQASFDLFYEYECRLTEKTNYLEGKLSFNALEVSHDSNFRGFYFTDELYPASVQLTFDLLANEEVVYSMTENIPLAHLNQAQIRFNFNDIQPATYYTLAIKDMSFNYSNTQTQAASRKKSAINQYFAAEEDLNELQKALNSLENYTVDPDRIQQLSADVNNWAIQFDKIDKASFWSILALQGSNNNDPADLIDLRTTVDKGLSATKDWVNELKGKLHELYYEKGVRLFENRQIADAQRAFEKSLQNERKYAPSHHFLAVIDFGKGNIEAAAERTINVINHYRPDGQTRQLAEALARDIILLHFDTGQKAVDQGHYPEGVAFFQQALAFSETIRGFYFGQEEAKSRIREAYHQDFHSQLDEVVYLNRQGNHEQALAYLEQALDFQEQFQVASNFDTYALHKDIVHEVFENKHELIHQLAQDQSLDEAIQAIHQADQFIAEYQPFFSNMNTYENLKKQVFNEKYQLLSQLAKDNKTAGKLDQALDEANNAASFAKKYKLASSTQAAANQLIQNIQKARYQRFLQGGNKARSHQDFQAALDQFNAAQGLENELSYIPTSIELSQKIKGTALQEIKHQFNKVMKEQPDNNQEIERVFTHIQTLSGRYHLALDSEVKVIYQQLEDQQCTNAQHILLPMLEKKLDHLQSIKDFPAARETIMDIKKLLAKYPDCDLSDEVVRQQTAGVELCAAYQETLETAINAENQDRYRAALDHYLRAKDLYQNPLVSNQLAAHPAFNTYDYVLNHTDNRMLMAGANVFLDQRKHEEALSLLKALLAKEIPPKRTEILQERLGSALAVKHFVDGANWKVVFAGFINKSEAKKLKDLKRSFRKQWRKMG